ncbi:MAG: hypothetical protein KDD44_14475, partial [Bdellovibrionales bacterium]|nr:hypothetical protein [Bdellovibrionales bacterium]
ASSSTKLHYWESLLSKEQIDAAEAIAKGERDVGSLDDFSDTERAAILELAYEYLTYLRMSVYRETSSTADRAQALLVARSQLKEGPALPAVPVPAVRPDQGHESRRVSLIGGLDDDQWFYEFHWRPAFHDMLDPREGYDEGAQIDFFDLRFRQRESDEFKLERFTPVAIESLAPRDRLLRPISWRVGGWVGRKRFAPDTDRLIGRLSGGPGMAFSHWRGLSYFFVDTAFEIAEEYDGNAVGGLGGEVGSYLDVSDTLRLKLSGGAERFVLGDEHNTWFGQLDLGYELGTNALLKISGARKGSVDAYWNELSAGIQLYF